MNFKIRSLSILFIFLLFSILFTGSASSACPQNQIVPKYRDYSKGKTVNKKVALFNPDQNGDYGDLAGCRYADKDGDVNWSTSSNPAEQFQCTDSSGIKKFNNPTNSQYVKNRAKLFCAGYKLGGGATPMPMALYFLPKKAIPLGKTWADSEGISENIKFQTLHRAEKSYSGPDFPDRAVTWFKKGVSDSRLYDATNSHLEYVKAWDVANTHADGTSAVDSDNSVIDGNYSDDATFEGGFYGVPRNSNRDWDYINNEWKSTSPTRSFKDIKAIPYKMKDIDNDNTVEGEYVGFEIEKNQIKKWESAYTAFEGRSGVKDLEIRSVCWAGEKPPNSLTLTSEYTGGVTKVSNFDTNSDSTLDKDVVIAMKVPQRSTTLKHPQKFECHFGFQQNITKAGKLSRLLLNAWRSRGRFNFGNWNQSFKDPAQVSGDLYITEGLNIAGSIKVNRNQPNAINPSKGTSYSNAQDFLSAKASKTTTSGVYPVFDKFPLGKQAYVKKRNPFSETQN